jgi:hypothetical protein
MRRRLLPPLLLLLLLALPSGAEAAAMQHFSTPSSGDDAVTPKQALRKAASAMSGRAGQGRELTPLLKDLAVSLPALRGADRTRARRILARPTLGETASNEDGYTVPEHSGPFCSAHFCIHWVDSTTDAPPGAAPGIVPSYVNTMSGVFEQVYDRENNQLGWRPPTSDGSRGCPNSAPDCMNKTDVYIKNVGGQGVYGYSAPDPGQGTTLSQYAYLVMDNDYSASEFPKYGGDPLQPMEVTAAHEYNHVLQFGYDVAQDTWMLESTAVWMEDKVYTEINDYLQYITPWTQMSLVPLTTFDSNSSDDPINVKVYGDTVWNRWLDTKYGEDAPRIAWEHSLTSRPKSFAPGAYDQMLATHGSSFFSGFTQFAADTAEWRSANSPFAEGSTFPDMERQQQAGKTIQLKINNGGAGGALKHTTFALLDVAPSAAPRVKAVLNSPRGVETAVALVGRIGDETTGTYESAITRMPKGGPGSVTLTDPSRFSRITAVLINGDGRTTGRFSRTLQDWEWKGDSAQVTARASTDFTPPKVRKRSPGARQTGVSRRPVVHIRFSEAMMNVGTRTVLLLAPGGHKVKAKVKLSSGRRLQVKPSKRLRANTRYTLRLSRDIEDLGANQLATSARTWSFRTRR